MSTDFTLKKGTKRVPLGVHSLVTGVVPSRIYLVTLIKDLRTIFYPAGFCFDLIRVVPFGFFWGGGFFLPCSVVVTTLKYHYYVQK